MTRNFTTIAELWAFNDGVEEAAKVLDRWAGDVATSPYLSDREQIDKAEQYKHQAAVLRRLKKSIPPESAWEHG